MGRGLGFFQREVMESLDTRAAVYVADILPPNYSPSAYRSILRAVHSLEVRGLVKLTRYRCWAGAGRALVVSRPSACVSRNDLRKC